MNKTKALDLRGNALKQHPALILIVTFSYIIAVLSVDRYSVNRLIPFFIYPIFTILSNNIPLKNVFKRVLFALPFIIFIGIFNPVFDSNKLLFFGKLISAGWFSFISVIIKCILSVSASVLLINIIGIDGTSQALRTLRIPKIIVSQFSFTYRYMHIFSAEVIHILTAYKLRAPMKKGIDLKNFGSLCGGLFLRSHKMADNIYSAMLLRGFKGDFPTIKKAKLTASDIFYTCFWITFFIILNFYDISLLAGNFILGHA